MILFALLASLVQAGADAPGRQPSAGHAVTSPGQTAFLSIRTPTAFSPEPFYLSTPVPKPTTPQPLLVLFHSASHTCFEPLTETALFTEANRRGWYVVCSLGAAKKHYASEPFRIHTELVLDTVLAMLNTQTETAIDVDRIYAIGFSMGAGAAANYAATHLSPEHAMFAGVIGLSGAYSNTHTHATAPATVGAILEVWFGTGTPGMIEPFAALRSSIFDLDALTGAIDPGTDLARNLLHVPTHVRYAELDAKQYVVDQSRAFADHLTALGHAAVSVREELGSSAHAWSLMEPGWACDFLEPLTLQRPTAASTLADRNGRYFDLLVRQDAATEFTPFTWQVDAAANTLAVSGTRNLSKITLLTGDAGLDPMNDLVVHIGPSPDLGTSDRVVLGGYASAPSQVLRDDVTATSGPDWSHDPGSLELTLYERDPGLHAWKITP